jgi:hypothetical protein
MPDSKGPKRTDKATPHKQPGSPDIWATLGPRSREQETEASPAGPWQNTPIDPFPRLPAKFGRYKIERKLGGGAMGAVYLARDNQLGRDVALKVPRFTTDDGPGARSQFLREARAAAKTQHANLCTLFDVGVIDGMPYLTMAFIEGRTLSEFIADIRDALPERQVAALVRKLALGLVELHQVEVVHRDLKPANIMLKPGGEPVIMDFGLARRGTGGGRPKSTAEEGQILGTPAYMAPEQADADFGPVGPHSDVYSLGVILYELLTKKVPFTGPDVYTVLSKLLREEPKSPFAHRPSLDPRLEAICMRALAKRPENRYQGMADFAAALTSYLMLTGPAASAEAASVPARPKPTSPPAARKRRRVKGELSAGAWAGVIGAVAAAAAVLGLGLFLMLRPSKSEVRFELSHPDARAEFRIDGEAVPLDPANPRLRLPVGAHRLDVVAEGFKPLRLDFEVKRWDGGSVTVAMERAFPQAAAARQPEANGGDAPAPEKEAAPAPPPEPVALRWKSQAALSANRIMAPPLPRSELVFLDEFRDPKSGFDHDLVKGYGYLPDGTYIIQPLKGAASQNIQVPLDRANPANPEGPFAVEVSGQLTSPSGWWAIQLGDAEKPHAAGVILSTGGNVDLSGEATRQAKGWKHIGPDPTKNRVVNQGQIGAANKLLLVVIGRQLEVYVNQVAVCDPILLPREIVKPKVLLRCVPREKLGNTFVKFEYVAVYSAASLKPVTERGAVPK